ncbi:MAG: hypothetical protein RL172_312 [Bacteroidota bacterium]|jgi:hypothetical protein
MKRMKRTIYLVAAFLLFLLSANKSVAQYYFYNNSHYDSPLMFEFGASVGAMNCLTDVGGRSGLGKKFVKDLNMGNTQLNGSIYLTATYKEKFALRLEGSFGKIKAFDSILSNVKDNSQGRYERNLSFQSKISEISLVAEIHPLFIFVDWVSRDQEPPYFSPYLVGGIGFFSFNPQAKSRTGKFVDLQPLSLEGQGFAEYPTRKTYSLSQINFPLGAGVRYELSPSLNLRAEFLYRKLSTDYLDDVSTRYVDPSLFSSYLSGTQLQDALDLSSNQRTNNGPVSFQYRKSEGGIRGNPKNDDAYFTFNLKIGFTFGRESR